jgi:hypothetical protein
MLETYAALHDPDTVSTLLHSGSGMITIVTFINPTKILPIYNGCIYYNRNHTSSWVHEQPMQYKQNIITFECYTFIGTNKTTGREFGIKDPNQI